MILAAVLSPLAFVPPPTEREQPAFFALMIHLLRDIEENCVVLVDSEPSRVTQSGIEAAVGAWPLRYRKPALEILVKLVRRHRLVPVPQVAEAQSCAGRPCRYVVGIFTAQKAGSLLVASDCEATVRKQSSAAEVFTPHTYPLSKFAELRRASTCVSISSGTLSQTEAEARIFAPVFRYARHVKIVDRYIGRSVPAGGPGAAMLGQDYRRSLEWLCNLYMRAATRRDKQSTFEIWCGIEPTNLSRDDVAASINELRKWESKMRASGMVNLKIQIKKETYKQELPHARYLITDQLALLVERGFDILLSDAQMRARSLEPRSTTRLLRDCEVVLIRDAARVEAEVRRLDDL